MSVLLLLVAPGARGEERDPPLVHDTGGIVVEAEREAPPTAIFEDSPVEVQEVTRQEIEDTATGNAAEIVSRFPGFRTQQRVQGEEAAVSIEGLPPEYTKILVNGQRYTGVIGEVADLSDVPVTNVDRIELKRGSQGIRYGSDSAGGVIDVVTRPAPDSGVRVTSEAGGGTDGQLRASGTVAPRLGPVGLTLSYTHDQIDGFDSRGTDEFVRPRIGGSDSQRRTDDIYATVEGNAAENLLLFARGGWRMEEEDIVTEQGVEAGTRDFDRALATGGLEWQVTDAVSWRNEFTYYGGISHDEAIRSIDVFDVEYKVDSGVDTLWELGPVSNLLYTGVDFRLDTLALDTGELPFETAPCTGVGDDAPPCVDVTAGSSISESFTNTGFILQNESALLDDRVALILGMRFQLHSEFENQWLPQAGLLLKPLPGLRVRLYWSRNYRTPSLRDLYQPETIGAGGNYLIGGNPSLQPEESDSWRAGFEWSPAEWITVASTGFWNEIDDYITTVPDANPIQIGTNEVGIDTPNVCRLAPDLDICQAQGPRLAGVPGQVFRPANLDFVRTRGFETQLRMRPHRLVSLFVGWTFLDTKVDSVFADLKELPNEPRHTVDLHATLQAPVIDTRLGVTARYRGSSTIDVSGTGIPAFSSLREGPASWVVDLRLTQPVLERFALFFDVRNVGDTEVVDSYEIRGRTFFAGLRVNFDPR